MKGLDKDKIIQNILNEINATKVKKSGVEGLYLSSDKKILGLREFINLIKGNFVPGNDPFFINDNFLMGVVNGETKDFFILLKMRSTADIFDALRAWENKMFLDLYQFFGPLRMITSSKEARSTWGKTVSAPAPTTFPTGNPGG